MPKDLQRHPRLLIVSDTSMYRNGTHAYGLGPVVREVENFAHLFDRITWIGFDEKHLAGNSGFLPIDRSNIRPILLPKSGGNSFRSKIDVLLKTPYMVWVIIRELFRHSVVHTRAPSSPAFIAIVLGLLFGKRKTFWHKYAGNWNQQSPPRFYALQRSTLKKSRLSKVTINGRWPEQPKHALSFENPCIDAQERKEGLAILQRKEYKAPLTACFVGRVEEAKGVDRILEALAAHPGVVKKIHFIGNGPNRARYEARAAQLPLESIFHGFISHDEVAAVMKESQLLLLPSTASEGFPKVVAEGWNYGCVPVVSNVSAIPQYVNQENGYLWDAGGEQPFYRFFQSLDLDAGILKRKAEGGFQTAEKFTFDYYNQRIVREILGE